MALERRRGYIRVTDQDHGALERWSLPNYNDLGGVPKDTAMNYDPSWEPSVDERQDKDPALESDVELSMLTAEALEQIRQSAVDEGQEEGREQGFKEGRQAGFEEGKTAGFDEGKTAGLEQGLSEGKEKIDEHCQRLDEMLKKLAFPIEQIDTEVRQQVMHLVVQLTKAVIQTEVHTNEHVILNTLNETVNALPMAQRNITVYLHPDDLELVKSAHSDDDLKEQQWQFLAQSSFDRGDIQIASGDSLVDFKIEDRISQILARFCGQNPVPELTEPSDGIGANVLIDTKKSEDLDQPHSEHLDPSVPLGEDKASTQSPLTPSNEEGEDDEPSV